MDAGQAPCAGQNAFAIAAAVVGRADLATKLHAPPVRAISFDRAAATPPPQAPGRPPQLGFELKREVVVPPIAGMRDKQQRARILHALANHELQAAELFAWALLAFSDMPQRFHIGLYKIMLDEQLHCRLYIERLEALGARFGDFPVTGHFWHKLPRLTTPLDFVVTMGLTFENANLDFANEYRNAALAVGDTATAAVLAKVHDDEIAHVRFAAVWFRKLCPPGDWAAFCRHAVPPLGPARARGRTFDRAARERAGLTVDMITGLSDISATRPNGAPR